MKRRLKNEISLKKQIGGQNLNKSQAEVIEFEETLLKLANLTKDKIKMSDFTQRDRYNLLDLFVNNENTLLKMYEVLFPHRVAVNI
mgnify:CR=1 FL=1